MQFKYNDGGRSRYTNIPSKHDCAVRAVAIATGEDYQTIYAELRIMFPSLESEGVNVGSLAFTDYMKQKGFVYVSGHTDMSVIPHGNVIASTMGHLTAIIDGVINDVRDESGKIVPYYWVRGKVFDIFRAGKKVNSAPLNGSQAYTMHRLLSINHGQTVHLKSII